MAAPTADEQLAVYEDLNYPSANKLRAALLKKGFKVSLNSVTEFVKSQTPSQLFAKAPKFRGKIIASRPNERWAIDFVDFSAEPSGANKYILLIQDIFSRKLWATAFADKSTSTYIEHLKGMFADTKPAEINAGGEFDNKAFNQFLNKNGVATRYKEGKQDLATIDAAMHNIKKTMKKLMQAQNTKDWAPLLSRVIRAHNRLAHEALMGDAEPNEAYDGENKALQFEMREEAGKKMAQQNAVVESNQKNALDNGGFRTFIEREQLNRRRGDRPQYSGNVHLVSAVEGNRVKDEDGKTHSLTVAKPVPRDSQSTNINVRLSGSAQTEEAKRSKLRPHADNLKILLLDKGPMFMGTASQQLQRNDPNFKKDLAGTTFKQFVDLFPNLFKSQTSTNGGTSRAMLKGRAWKHKKHAQMARLAV